MGVRDDPFRGINGPLGSLQSCNLMKWWFEYVVNWAIPNLYIGNGCDYQTSIHSKLLDFDFSRMGIFVS